MTVQEERGPMMVATLEQQQSGEPLPFTCEDDFTHYNQDKDHDSSRVSPSVGAIGKPYGGR